MCKGERIFIQMPKKFSPTATPRARAAGWLVGTEVIVVFWVVFFLFVFDFLDEFGARIGVGVRNGRVFFYCVKIFFGVIFLFFAGDENPYHKHYYDRANDYKVFHRVQF